MAPVAERIAVVGGRGLHLRPAARIAVLAAGRGVTVALNGRTARADSPLGLLQLGAVAGTVLRLQAEGPDAAALLEAIAAVLAADEPSDP